MAINPIESQGVSLNGDLLVNRIVAIVREIALELHPDTRAIDQLGPESSIERDFGLDSLAFVELASRIERTFAVRVSEEELAAAETPRELAQVVRAAQTSPSGSASSAQPQGDKPPSSSEIAVGVNRAPSSVSTLVDALEWHVAQQPDRTHILLIDHEAAPERMSFADLRREAFAVAAGLTRRGIKRGATVAIMLPTGRQFFAAFYGALYAQAIPVPLYPPARPSQIETHLRRVAGILANCEARVLLTFERAKRVAYLLRSLDTRVETIATLDEIAAPAASFSAPSLRTNDIAFLQYTSGSTGRPKGVILTHANLLANVEAMQRATGISSSDCFVSWLPLYHDMGLIGACFGALLAGFPLVLMSPFTFLSHPPRWLWAIHHHHGTVTAAPNFAYEVCLSKIRDDELTGLDLSTLRMAFNGAEAVSPQTVERFAQRFASYDLKRGTLMPVYGLAECALGLAFPPVGRAPLVDKIDRAAFMRKGVARVADSSDPAPLGIISCGKPLPRHMIRIVDTKGNLLPERTQGRIEFRGPSATSGYFRNAQDTASLFDGDWLDTGDLGYFANGEIYIGGRAKDIIVRAGHHIHPQELEESVGQLPAVRKGGVAVFPAIDRRSGTERIIVLAETREQDAAARSELMARISRLAVDLIGLPVDEVVLAPPRTVLKTSSGKIRRAACREAYERGELNTTQRAPWLQIARLGYQAFRIHSARAVQRLTRTAWGCWALFVASCFAPLVWSTVVLTSGLHRRRRVACALVSVALKACGLPLRVSGLEHTAGGSRVFVANHASYADSVALITVLPPEVSFIAKRELAKVFALGLLLKRLGCLFVERHDLQEAAADARGLREHLQQGESILLFAEGTLQRDAGLLPFHMGAFLTAAASEVPVVPVAIRGTRALLPDGALLPHRASIDLIFGEPLTASVSGWPGAIELRSRARKHILAHIAEPDLE